MISTVSAALRKILNPIRVKNKDSEVLSSKLGSDVMEHESPQEGYQPPPQKEDPQENEKSNVVSAHSKITNESQTKTTSLDSYRNHSLLNNEESNPSEEFKKRSNEEVGLTNLILQFRKCDTPQHAENVTHQYETGAREQRSNVKLPKGAMIDKKVS